MTRRGRRGHKRPYILRFIGALWSTFEKGIRDIFVRFEEKKKELEEKEEGERRRINEETRRIDEETRKELKHQKKLDKNRRQKQKRKEDQTGQQSERAEASVDEQGEELEAALEAAQGTESDGSRNEGTGGTPNLTVGSTNSDPTADAADTADTADTADELLHPFFLQLVAAKDVDGIEKFILRYENDSGCASIVTEAKEALNDLEQDPSATRPPLSATSESSGRGEDTTKSKGTKILPNEGIVSELKNCEIDVQNRSAIAPRSQSTGHAHSNVAFFLLDFDSKTFTFSGLFKDVTEDFRAALIALVMNGNVNSIVEIISNCKGNSGWDYIIILYGAKALQMVAAKRLRMSEQNDIALDDYKKAAQWHEVEPLYSTLSVESLPLILQGSRTNSSDGNVDMLRGSSSSKIDKFANSTSSAITIIEDRAGVDQSSFTEFVETSLTMIHSLNDAAEYDYVYLQTAAWSLQIEAASFYLEQIQQESLQQTKRKPGKKRNRTRRNGKAYHGDCRTESGIVNGKQLTYGVCSIKRGCRALFKDGVPKKRFASENKAREAMENTIRGSKNKFTVGDIKAHYDDTKTLNVYAHEVDDHDANDVGLRWLVGNNPHMKRSENEFLRIMGYPSNQRIV